MEVKYRRSLARTKERAGGNGDGDGRCLCHGRSHGCDRILEAERLWRQRRLAIQPLLRLGTIQQHRGNVQTCNALLRQKAALGAG